MQLLNLEEETKPKTQPGILINNLADSVSLIYFKFINLLCASHIIYGAILHKH